MKRILFLMAMAITMQGFTACTDDNSDNPAQTASVEQPVTQTEDAVTVKVPFVFPGVKRPLLSILPPVEVHVTSLSGITEPSERKAFAVNWIVSPFT